MKSIPTLKRYDLDAKTINIDLEKSPTKGWAYKSWEATVFDVEEDWHIQSVAWKWGTKDTVHCVALPDFPLYKKEPHNDKELVEFIYSEVKKANLIVGHNIIRFDIPMLRHRFMIHGLAPLPKIPMKDTMRMAKKFGFFNKSLNGICRELGFESKEETGVKELWKKCYDGVDDKKYWPLFKKYNKKDVYLDDLVYRRFMAWEDTMPRMNTGDDCPVCQSTRNEWKRNGVKYYRLYMKQRYECLKCGYANLYGPPMMVE